MRGPSCDNVPWSSSHAPSENRKQYKSFIPNPIQVLQYTSTIYTPPARPGRQESTLLEPYFSMWAASAFRARHTLLGRSVEGPRFSKSRRFHESKVTRQAARCHLGLVHGLRLHFIFLRRTQTRLPAPLAMGRRVSSARYLSTAPTLNCSESTLNLPMEQVGVPCFLLQSLE